VLINISSQYIAYVCSDADKSQWSAMFVNVLGELLYVCTVIMKQSFTPTACRMCVSRNKVVTKLRAKNGNTVR